MEKEVEISEQRALAYDNIRDSLTPEILRQKELEVMELAIREGSQPLLIFGSNATPLINIPSRKE
mgnify:CR=1 FL=1